jgi:STE24 endopeptidase
VNEDRSTRYHRLKRRASIAALLWSAGFLALVVGTGASAILRDWSQELAEAAGAGRGAAAAVAVYVALLSLFHELGSAPISLYSGFVVEREYGLSNEGFGRWLLDEAKGLALGLVFGVIAASLLYWSIRQWPGTWWLPAGALFTILVLGLTNLAPVLLLPLFYRVTPLERAALRSRLLTLAERAGTRVVGAYEWGLGAKTRKANAALAGFGATRRILVSDTMLADYSDEEIEVVLAHELAHHVHGDIWKGIVFEMTLIFAGFYLSAAVLARAVGPLGLRGASDVAGLPVLLLAAGGVSVAMVPAALAMSRAHERSADRFALRLTNNPTAFVSAMRRLAAQNLAEERPPKIIQWLFYSHPPIHERIAAARAFKGRTAAERPA